VQDSNVEIIWASVREPYNVVQAERAGCQVITVFPEVLRRLERFGRDLDEFARETSEMFYQDAVSSGFSL
jgi:transaldolase